MTRRNFSFRKLVAMAGLVAIAVAVVESGPRRSAASAPPVDELNLRNENTTMETYLRDYVAYSKECAQLSKKANLLRTEVDGVERKAEDLKQRLSGIQNVARTIVSKLKAAGKWENLNALILSNTTDPRERSLVQSINFKAEIEEAAATLGSRGQDIGVPVANLRRRVAMQSLPANDNPLMVRANYEPAVPLANVSLACSAGRLLLGAIKAVGGKASDTTLDVVSCACGPSCPGCGYGITGTSCSSLGFGAAT